jgi:IS30 family transposase
MGRSYRHLDLEDRCTIARLHDAGHSLRQIAAALDRPASTISRELKRNRGRLVGYKPAYAEEQTRARRWTGSRLERDQLLRNRVLDRLALGWSPEAVAGRLALDAGARVISHESIYRFIYAQLRRTQDFSWRRYLPRAKSKRGWRGRPGGSPAHHIKGRTPIAQRSLDADDRATPRHWEGDTMLFATYGQVILAAHERTSRAVLIARQPGKLAADVADQLECWLAPLPPELRRSITFDNGTEFADHRRLQDHGLATFFCDVRSPWQKGGIENAIGRLRRFLPRKANLDDFPPALVQAAAKAYNNTPRKCLGYQTPAETFNLLHFKCESTCQPALA